MFSGMLKATLIRGKSCGLCQSQGKLVVVVNSAPKKAYEGKFKFREPSWLQMREAHVHTGQAHTGILLLQSLLISREMSEASHI